MSDVYNKHDSEVEIEPNCPLAAEFSLYQYYVTKEVIEVEQIEEQRLELAPMQVTSLLKKGTIVILDSYTINYYDNCDIFKIMISVTVKKTKEKVLFQYKAGSMKYVNEQLKKLLQPLSETSKAAKVLYE